MNMFQFIFANNLELSKKIKTQYIKYITITYHIKNPSVMKYPIFQKFNSFEMDI